MHTASFTLSGIDFEQGLELGFIMRHGRSRLRLWLLRRGLHLTRSMSNTVMFLHRCVCLMLLLVFQHIILLYTYRALQRFGSYAWTCLSQALIGRGKHMNGLSTAKSRIVSKILPRRAEERRCRMKTNRTRFRLFYDTPVHATFILLSWSDLDLFN